MNLCVLDEPPHRLLCDGEESCVFVCSQELLGTYWLIMRISVVL